MVSLDPKLSGLRRIRKTVFQPREYHSLRSKMGRDDKDGNLGRGLESVHTPALGKDDSCLGCW